MDSSTATDLVHDALTLALVLAVPGLAVAFVVALIAGFLQALTQIQDQSLSTVPRLIAGALALLLLVPWMLDRLTTFTIELYEGVAASL
ncbi:MAG: flagellar biosynthetic protein FliQ [Planctomycetaceae bacterium]